MAKEKTAPKKKKAPKKEEPKQPALKRWQSSIKERVSNLLMRRPHRSFKKTERRDYQRSLALPGYWALTNDVRKILWRNKKLFLALALIYGILTFVVVGLVSQASFKDYADTLRESGGKLFEGQWWEIGQAAILFTGGVLGALNNSPGDVEKFVAVLLGLLVWLTTIWLLRAIMAGKRPYLRDALYNAGAPIISTFLVFLIAAIQLLPVALAALAFAAASTTGLVDDGIESMVFWAFELLLLTLTLYWITSTLFGMVVVTLPGMYPFNAIRTAGDLVIGRRIRILLRLLWGIWLTIAIWAVVMIPLILLDTWLKSIYSWFAWFPLIPILLLVIASLSIVWLSAYMYIFYRKVVDDDAAPA
jgi:hypothetical protein